MKKLPGRFLTALYPLLFFLFTFCNVRAEQKILNDSLIMDTISGPAPRLKVLSWNIGMLPLMDIIRPIDDRAQAIASALQACDYDIIVFQEAFTAPSRTIIYQALHNNYPYSYGPVNGSGLSLKFNSGIWIISRIPLTVRKEIKFSVSAGFDAFARKGAVLLEGVFSNRMFQLIATHLQDDDYPQAIRDQQLTEIFEQLILPYSDMNTPQIICGDLNTSEQKARNYQGMLAILQAEDGAISGKTKVTFDDESNDAFRSGHPNPRLIDYILTRNSHVIEWINRRVAVLKMKWGSGMEYLSDHNGIEAVIVFRKGDYLTRVFR